MKHAKVSIVLEKELVQKIRTGKKIFTIGTEYVMKG